MVSYFIEEAKELNLPFKHATLKQFESKLQRGKKNIRERGYFD
jgi:hypothetical protein